MKVVLGKTLGRSAPVFALALALMASAEAKAGLLSPSLDPAAPALSDPFAQFPSFDHGLFEPKDRPAAQDPFSEGAGGIAPTKAPGPEHQEIADQVAAMHAAVPADAAGAGTVTNGQGPSSQVPAISPAHELPTPQAAMWLRMSDQSIHISLPPADLFRPPRTRGV